MNRYSQPDPAGGLPPPDEDLGVAHDRRRAHREAVVAIARLSPAARALSGMVAEPIQAIVKDLSLRGAHFRTQHAVSVGESYDLDLVLGPLKVSSRLRVVRVRQLPDGTYDAGSEFV